MQYKDLTITPNDQLSEDELQEKIRQLQSMKITTDEETGEPTMKKAKTIKSNRERKAESLVSKLSPEDLAKLIAQAQAKKG